MLVNTFENRRRSRFTLNTLRFPCVSNFQISKQKTIEFEIKHFLMDIQKDWGEKWQKKKGVKTCGISK